MVDHDTGALVWAGKNRTAATLREFFGLLGQARSAQLTHVSCDGAEWIHDVVAERAPQAVLCLDDFYGVAWATAALDAVRRGVWNQLRRRGDKGVIKGARDSKALLWPLGELLERRSTPATLCSSTTHEWGAGCAPAAEYDVGRS